MKKRMLSTLLACVLAVGMLAGCGDKAVNKEESKTSSEATSESKEEVKKETPSETKKEDPITIKWLQAGTEPADFDRVMEDLNKKLVEKINIKLELEMIPGGEFNERVRLASTSGEDFDLMYTSNWRNKFDDNMAREALLPLDDLLEEYGQGILASNPEWLMNHARVNGEIYAVPNQQIEAFQLGLFVQKKYADEYGLDITEIKDMRELFPFFEWCKEKYPDMYPYKADQAFYDQQTYESFASGTIKVNKKDGTVLHVAEAEAALDFADPILMRECLDKGYIQPDIATVTDTSADVKANRYISILNTWKPGGAESKNASTGVEWIAIPAEGAYVKATAGQGTMTAINVNSKNPEAAMILLNTIYTDKEIFNELIYGLEGVHYVKDGENRIKLVEDSGYNLSGSAWAFGDQFLAYLLPGQDDDLWEQTRKMNEESTISAVTGFVFDPSNVQSELAQVSAVEKEYGKMHYTTNDMDALLKERNEKRITAGVEAIKEEFEKQLDAWKAANGK